MSLLKTKNIFNNSKYLNIVKKQFSLTKFILENRFKTKILKSNENSFTRLYRGNSNKYFSTQEEPTLESQLENFVKPELVRNVAIIAHVDHGKTTLVDCMLKQSGVGINTSESMDSNDLEKERGITILSKCTSIMYNGKKINIVDTPGHQDFGGEVERIMSMVDSVCLVVCASEGPMPQTKYVLRKALSRGFIPIVVINKVDRNTARVEEVENEIFDLFINLDANEEQMNYKLIYASAKSGWASLNKKQIGDSVLPLLNLICDDVPYPKVDQSGELKMLISQIESNSFFGKMLIGRIDSGFVEVGQKVNAIDQEGNISESAKIFKIIKRVGMKLVHLNKAYAGDIVQLAGFKDATVTHTINKVGNNHVIKSIPIDPPMISMIIKINDSPYYGKDGDKFTYTQLSDRLIKEAESDVSLKVVIDNKKKDHILVYGRGDLHLGILIEKMRREGYEMAICPPQVIFQTDKNNNKLEPIEILEIIIHEAHTQFLYDFALTRYGEISSTTKMNDDKVKIIIEIPTRGIFGLRTKLISMTKGDLIFQSKLKGYEPYKGPIKRVSKGAIIAIAKGKCTTFSLKDVENHGELFVVPGTEVYEGNIIGELNKEGGEVEVNPCKEKPSSNVRTTVKEENVKLQPIKPLSIEDCIVMLRGDELLEVTPKNLRIRKTILDSSLRRKMKREKKLDENL